MFRYMEKKVRAKKEQRKKIYHDTTISEFMKFHFTLLKNVLDVQLSRLKINSASFVVSSL